MSVHHGGRGPGHTSRKTVVGVFDPGDTPGVDDLAPVLSSPVGTQTSPTTATVGATTDEDSGVIRWVVTTSSTAPTSTQITNGQDHLGAAASASDFITVGSVGAKTDTATGLTASTAYYAHLVHIDLADNVSNIVTSAEFTTAAAPDVTAPTLTLTSATGDNPPVVSRTIPADVGEGDYIQRRIDTADTYDTGNLREEERILLWDGTDFLLGDPDTFEPSPFTIQVGLDEGVAHWMSERFRRDLGDTDLFSAWSNDVTFTLGSIPLALSVAAEGDSQTSPASSYAERWAADNPTIPFYNSAVGSTALGLPSDFGGATSSVWSRLDDVIAQQPSIVTLLTGGNDEATSSYGSGGAQGFYENMIEYARKAKIERPGIKVVFIGILPDGIGAGQNTNRAIINPQLRAAVGTEIDAYIPLGDHPAFTDAAGETADGSGVIAADKVHMTSLGQGIAAEVYAAVMDPLVAGTTGNTPTLSAVTDQANVAPSDTVEQWVYVSGMGPGETATVSVDVGTAAIGQGGFSSSPGTVQNGDVITVRLTASATASAVVEQNLTVGTTNATWSVTTEAAVAAAFAGLPKVTAASSTTPPLPFTMPESGRVVAVLIGSSNVTSATIKNGGVTVATATKYEAISNQALLVFDNELVAGDYTLEPVLGVAIATEAFIGYHNSSSGTPVATGRETTASFQNPGTLDIKFSTTVASPFTQTVPSGGIGVLFAMSGGGLTGDYYGNTLAYSYVSDNAAWFTFSSSKVPQIGNQGTQPNAFFSATFNAP